MFGIGKSKALSAAEKFPLQLLGQDNANITEVIEEAKQFVGNSYEMKETSLSKSKFCSNIFFLFHFIKIFT